MRYVFDISDAGGRNVKLTWDLNDNNLKELADLLVAENRIFQYKDRNRETLLNVIKDFTKEEIKVIMKEEFEERISELKRL